MLRSLGLGALALIAVAGRAHGQTAGTIIDYETLTKSAVGSWADYTMTLKKSNETKKSRSVLVERASQRLVLENRLELTVGTAVFRFEYERVRVDGSDAWKVSAATTKIGAAEPTAIPSDKLASTLVAKGTSMGKLLGTEKVVTPAGTFECQHFVKATRMAKEDVVVDVWMSPKATPTGMVKSVIAAKGIEVLLAAVGNDGAAKPK